MTGQEILSTKLYIPSFKSNMTSRPRLVEALNGGLDQKLILVSAPAGFGKTTLLSEWISTHDGSFCWLSLDQQDNKLERFLTYVITSLRSIQVEIKDEELEPLDVGPGEKRTGLLIHLINQAAQFEKEIILVLDDYHQVSSAEIHDAVAFLLDHLPENMHLVIATRIDPALSLAQLRARGELCEIRAADLRFSIDEAIQFFSSNLDEEIEGSDVTTLTNKTEGWIAGLQMAAISLEKCVDKHSFVTAFAGNDRFIADYLLDEALHSQPAPLQTFLLQTSILDRLNPELCNAITGWTDSKDVLQTLERANLFIVPLDNQRTWYRYHHLFADLLKSHLSYIRANELQDLHLRASRVYEQNGLLSDAIQHALAANHVERIVQLTQHMAVHQMDQDELNELIEWLDRLTGEMFMQFPWLLVTRTWALFNRGKFEATETSLAEIERILAHKEYEQNLVVRVRGHVAAIRSHLAEMREDPNVALQQTTQALVQLPQEDLKLRAFVAIRRANCLSWLGDFENAIPAYRQAGELGKQAGDGQLAISAISEVAVMQMLTGKLRQADESIQEIEAYALKLAQKDGRRLPAMGILYRHMSNINREHLELAKAVEHARQAIGICRQWGDKESLLLAYEYLAMALFPMGNRSEAYQNLEKAIQLAGQISSQYIESISQIRCHFLLREGRISEVEEWFQGKDLDPEDAFGYDLRNTYAIYARVLISRGKMKEALKITERLVSLVEAAGAGMYSIRYKILKAVCLWQMTRTKEAMGELAEALTLAEPEGFVHSCIIAGEMVVPVLFEASRQGLHAAFCRRLLEEFHGQTGQAGRQPAKTNLVVEMLSERELEVLALIAEGNSNQEIANVLILSLFTVKSHARNIYGKLGVKNRVEAVARARLLGLFQKL